MIMHGRQQAGRAEPSAKDFTRRTDRRDAMEHLLRWADHLAPAERSLVRCAYDWGVCSREISLLTGWTPRVVRRRLRQLLQRIDSPVFQNAVRLLGAMSEDRRSVAQQVVLQGLTQRQAAAQLGVSVHQVRRELLAIHGMCEIAQSNRVHHRFAL
jgi:DNA-directed RNA polymerase specialized sigma24 family protein